MSRVTVHNAAGEQLNPSLLERLQSAGDRIRSRAYEIFEHRDSARPAADDWFQAERELTLSTSSELVEKDGRFELSIAVPGFEASEIDVTALPEAIVVAAESAHRHDGDREDVHYCEFTGKTLMKQIPLPHEIDAENVTANLNDGILRVVAGKASAAGRKIAAAG